MESPPLSKGQSALFYTFSPQRILPILQSNEYVLPLTQDQCERELYLRLPNSESR